MLLKIIKIYIETFNFVDHVASTISRYLASHSVLCCDLCMTLFCTVNGCMEMLCKDVAGRWSTYCQVSLPHLVQTNSDYCSVGSICLGIHE